MIEHRWVWFGKGCEFFRGRWEDDEITGGPNFMEAEPVLCFCAHEKNPEETEGNCRKSICPLLKGDGDGSETN